MDGLIVVGGLLLLAMPVAVIYLLMSHSALKSRVANLELDMRRQARSTKYEAETSDTTEQAPDIPPADLSQVKPQSPAPATATGPWVAKANPPLDQPADTPPKAIVMRADRFADLGNWLRENWFYAVAAVSLALAGLFLVQYGMENGLLPPKARVAAALGFGAALIAAGEYIRRRFGDSENSNTAYLPSTFSGAGIVTLFGGILSARLLYDLIGPETAFAGMIATALIAIVLGWFHGPLLAAVGVIGAMVTPFIVGGASDDPSWLYGYFALITLVGLGVDAVRRWAWISVIALVLGYGAGWLLMAGDGQIEIPFALYLTALALMSIAVPVLKIWPNHAGSMLSETRLTGKVRSFPEFPTRLAAGALLTSALSLTVLALSGGDTFWMIIACLAALTLALMIWARQARALQDLTLLPAIAMIATVFVMSKRSGIVRAFQAELPPESNMPMQATWLVGLGLLISAVAAWRSGQGGIARYVWAGGAALFAPAMAMALELQWAPADTIGAYPWALHAAVIAGAMVFMAERFARADGPDDRLRMALATMSALACIAYAFVIVLSSAALTVALAVTVVAAAALDRRFDLRAMGVFISAGVVTLGYRLVVDPGLDWGQTAPIPEMLLAYGGTLAALIAALWLLRGRDRPVPNVMLDSAAWSTGGILVNLLLYRAIKASGGWQGGESHWSLSLTAMIWICLALAQLQRVPLGGRLQQVRLGLTGLFGILAMGGMLWSTLIANPAVNRFETVLGIPIFNTLTVAYLLPALLLLAGTVRIKTLPQKIRLGLQTLSAALAALWLALTIRHFWQGSENMASGRVSQPELYTYTLALLVLGGGLFYQSLARRSPLLRRAGLAVIGLAVAKVFFVDISGLGGLTRVFSLLALGLSLSGLAWLNRWAQTRYGDPSAPPDPQPEPEPEQD